MTHWEHETDLLVVGSGGGGMTAALVAKLGGIETLILEKTKFFGGSTALSGGAVWVPDNYVMAEAGIDDSFEEASLYLETIIGDRTPKSNQEAYVRFSREMLAYLHEHTQVQFQLTPGYTDYYPELPGGTLGGRGVEPIPVNGKLLGQEFKNLRPSIFEAPFGLALTSKEYRQVGMLTSTLEGLLAGVKIGLRAVYCQVAGIKLLTLGQALAARLRLSLLDANVPLWLSTPVTQLVLEDGRVVGVQAEHTGKTMHIKANGGVVLAAGGFPHNQEMRQKYQPHPITTKWSSANPGNTGDMIQLGEDHGAVLDLMEDAWWGPASLPPGATPFFHVGERAYPGGIIVNSLGQRFMNESAPYVDAVHEMYKHNGQDGETIPAYFIMDQRFRNKYLFGTLFPRQNIPQEYFSSGYFVKAGTLEELAIQSGIDPGGLVATIERFNKLSQNGIDQDYQRGKSAYDRYYGDPKVKPNPCLAPLQTPPFYSVKMYPGDIGTKGGLVTDDRGRVFKEDGVIIPGLYAVGNNSASVMGNSYPGPGGTIGPAMTFGYIAANDVIKELS
jgi:3-oxosteroid 1-dehydrogenase